MEMSSPFIQAAVTSSIKEVNHRLATGIPPAVRGMLSSCTKEQEVFLTAFLSSPIGVALLNLAEYGAAKLAKDHVPEGKGKEFHAVCLRTLEVGAYESLISGALKCIGGPMSGLWSLWGGSPKALMEAAPKLRFDDDLVDEILEQAAAIPARSPGAAL